MIFSYLNNQKEWIFSGIGVAIIIAIWNVIKKRVIFKQRLKNTPDIKFPIASPFPIYNFYFSKNEEDNKPTQSFIKNCSIKTHSLVLKKIKKDLCDYKSLIWIDIDKFTQINNLFGKECSDMVVDIILKILFVISKKFDCHVFHVKGRDEFYITISELYLKECASHFIGLVQQYDWSSIASDMFITCSAGIACNITNPIETMKKARVSLNLIKSKGGNGIGPDILKLHPYKLVNLRSS